jgi:hypothetical protein
MGLLDNLSEPAFQIPKCKVRTILAELQATDREALQKALDNPKWANSPLSKALAEKGIYVGDKSLKAHRHNECGCRFINNA